MIFFDELSICIGWMLGSLPPHFNLFPSESLKWQMHMDAMMQTRKQKVEKFFVFFVTKLGLLQQPAVVDGARAGGEHLEVHIGGNAPRGADGASRGVVCVMHLMCLKFIYIQ